MIDLFHPRSSPVIKRYFLMNEWEQYFLIERDEIDQERYFLKSCSVHLNGTGLVKNSISHMPGSECLVVTNIQAYPYPITKKSNI